MSVCPTEVTLQCLGAGILGELTFAGIEEHIQSCPKCQQVLQGAVGDDLRGPKRIALPRLEDVSVISGFHVERELGRGANGAVFLARETKLDRLVALKILPAGEVGATEDQSAWLSEPQAVSRLRHPNIVQLHQVREEQGWTILVLEYVPGGTLKERLAGPLAPQEAARVLETLARTIAHVHKAGLLHLDIKPSNILVDGEPGASLDAALLKVSDFGISLPFVGPAQTLEGFVGPRGTPSYMAPEQAGFTGAAIGPAADVYALGAILYHLLTGRPPFQSALARETFESIRTAAPIPPRGLNPRIPKDLEAICLHCLAKLPAGRYASADDLADDLRRFLDGRRVSVRPVASTEQVARWCRRRPVIAGLALSLVVTMLASISGLAYLLQRSEANRIQAVKARQQAEENEALASRTLEELDVWIQRVLAEPRLLEDRYLPSLVDNVPLLTEKLRGDEESNLRMIATVGLLQRDVAGKLGAGRSPRVAEAAALLARSRAYLTECLRRKPDSELLQEQYILMLLDWAVLAYIQEDFAQIERCYEEVGRLAPNARDRRLRIRSVIVVSTSCRNTVFKLGILGNDEAARRLLARNLEMLERLAAADAAAPDLRLQKALTLSCVGRSDEAVSVIRELTGQPPTDWLRKDTADTQLREWLVAPAVHGILSEQPEASCEDASELTRRSELLVEAVRQRARSIGLDRPDLPALFADVYDVIHTSCSTERRWNRVERRLGAPQRFLALAQEVARQYPDRAEPQVLISHAHHQVAKNAWYFDDEQAALAALQEAIDAARRAEGLDPDSAEARRLVPDLERRLAKSRRDMEQAGTSASGAASAPR